jgi:HAD superfamily hydrolase (TIGR01509 family)
MQRGLIFDCDGVLADTELHGHLAAFNLMWQRFGVPWRWSSAQYAEKLKIGGGKERMASLFRDPDFLRAVKIPESEEERSALILSWHNEKTAIFEEIIASGKVPPRAGIERLSQEALSAGWRLAVASTSARPAVAAVLKLAVGEMASEFSIFAGDVVRTKKPAPDIYLFAIGQLGIPASQCIAIEDSRNGLLSAHAAQIPVVITVSEFTRREKFDEARLVVTSLGNPQGEKSEVLANRMGREVGDSVDLRDLEAVIEGAGVCSD